MSYAERQAADRRLVILRLLVEDEGHANESVLEQGLIALGHRIGLDRAAVRKLCEDLERAGCVRLEYFRDRVMVAAITERGVAVSQGRIHVDGVAKPALGS